MKIDVGIIGASGYTGGELLRLLLSHPAFQVTWATSRTYSGRPVGEVFPHLGGFTDLVLEEPGLDAVPSGVKALILALPHTEAMDAVPVLLDGGYRVVDLSADFRLRDAALYEEWYATPHRAAGLLDEAVYGLTELYRKEIASARLVANPGCYPTAALLALVPLAERGLIEPGGIVIDAKSGVSGAGRSPKVSALFCEVNEGVKPYLAGRHRHIPEIEQELQAASGTAVPVTFTPHLVPLARGIQESIYVNLVKGRGVADVEKAYRGSYATEPFILVNPPGELPGLREAAGTNLCRLGFTADSRTGRVIISSAIDNLVKGASGQAVQNLNVMFGLEETAGLAGPGLFP